MREHLTECIYRNSQYIAMDCQVCDALRACRARALDDATAAVGQALATRRTELPEYEARYTAIAAIEMLQTAEQG